MASNKSPCCSPRCLLLFLGYFHLLLDLGAAILNIFIFGRYIVFGPGIDVMNLIIEIVFVTILLLDMIFIIFILVGKWKLYRCIYICGICFVVFLSLICLLGSSWYYYIWYFPGYQSLYYSIRGSLIVAISFVFVGVLIKIPQIVLIKEIGLRDDNTVKFVNDANEAKCVVEVKEEQVNATINDQC